MKKLDEAARVKAKEQAKKVAEDSEMHRGVVAVDISGFTADESDDFGQCQE